MSHLAFPCVTPAKKAATVDCLALVCEDSLAGNICGDESVKGQNFVAETRYYTSFVTGGG